MERWQAQQRVERPYTLPVDHEPVFWLKWVAPLPELQEQADDTLTGLGASPGSVTGVARVIESSAEMDRLQQGEILVARTTTPAWTPMFARAAALVTDLGGALSHGSIVARQYGIPAVMGIGSATQRIAGGQTITVDGTAGRVSLLGTTSPANDDVPGDDDWPVMEEEPPQPFDLWTQTNVGEVWPHPVSTLLWSAITYTLNESMRFTLRDLQAPYVDDIQIANRFYGRVYLNERALAHVFNQEFGLPGSFIDTAFGTRSSADLRHSDQFHPLRFLRRLPTFLRMTVGRMGTDQELEAMFAEIDRWVADFAARDLDESGDNETLG